MQLYKFEMDQPYYCGSHLLMPQKYKVGMQQMNDPKYALITKGRLTSRLIKVWTRNKWLSLRSIELSCVWFKEYNVCDSASYLQNAVFIFPILRKRLYFFDVTKKQQKGYSFSLYGKSNVL